MRPSSQKVTVGGSFYGYEGNITVNPNEEFSIVVIGKTSTYETVQQSRTGRICSSENSYQYNAEGMCVVCYNVRDMAAPSREV